MKTADVVQRAEVEREYGNAIQTAFNEGRLVGGEEVAREIIEETFKRVKENFVISPLCKSALSDLEAELEKKYRWKD